MVTSRTIRRNKHFPKSVESETIEDVIIRGKLAPLQTRISEFVFKNPSCTQAEIQKSMPDVDGGAFRKTIRTMIESRRIRQRFTIN